MASFLAGFHRAISTSTANIEPVTLLRECHGKLIIKCVFLVRVFGSCFSEMKVLLNTIGKQGSKQRNETYMHIARLNLGLNTQKCTCKDTFSDVNPSILNTVGNNKPDSGVHYVLHLCVFLKKCYSMPKLIDCFTLT